MDFADTRVSLTGQGVTTGTAASTVSGSTATVTVLGTTVTAQVARGLTLTVGDTVLITRQGSMWWVTCVLYSAAPAASPDPVPAPPAPKPTVVTGTLICPPVETRSYRSAGWRGDNDDVYQGQYGGWGNHTGCAFYGTKPRSLTGATVTGANLKIKRLSAGDYAARALTLNLVTQSTRPSGAPTLGSSTPGPSLAVGASTTFNLPVSWAQAIVDGTSGGIAVYDSSGSPYIRTAGRGSWSPAWTLTIAWRR